jgi:tRNA-specific 2-thiouridylase
MSAGQKKKTLGRVAVGLSGGVDSAVSAWLLKQQGYEVVGFFMRNWVANPEASVKSLCPAQKDFEDVVQVCNQMGIPYYALDFSKDYLENVFAHFVRSYEAGLTPNPDILCNKEIKFKVFLEKALSLGATHLATGHYAQCHEGRLSLSADAQKDQTYFLHTLKANVLEKVLFPVGGMIKSEVRRIAAEQNFRVSTKKDSTGICFIGERKFRDFMKDYTVALPGSIVDENGHTIGHHEGVAFYTIGQRKGFRIDRQKGQPTDGEAFFVAQKCAKTNTLTCVQGHDHPWLLSDSLTGNALSFVHPEQEGVILSCIREKGFFECFAKVRYRQTVQPCRLELRSDSEFFVKFRHPQRAVAPGQSVVFYDEQHCLGGGVILAAGGSVKLP